MWVTGVQTCALPILEKSVEMGMEKINNVSLMKYGNSGDVSGESSGKNLSPGCHVVEGINHL